MLVTWLGLRFWMDLRGGEAVQEAGVSGGRGRNGGWEGPGPAPGQHRRDRLLSLIQCRRPLPAGQVSRGLSGAAGRPEPAGLSPALPR